MASIYVLAKVLVDEFDLTPFFKAIKPSRARAELDTTTLASGRNAESMPGLKSGSFSAEGFFNAVPDGIDEVMRAALANAATKVVTVIDDNSVGADCELAKTNSTKYEISLQPAQITMASAEIKATDGIDSGVVLHALGAETATGNGADVNNVAATTKGGVAHLHVIGITGTGATATIKIQHSVDGSTWVDLVTFTAVNAATYERIEVAGTVNPHLRAIRTITGATPSVTYTVAFARRY